MYIDLIVLVVLMVLVVMFFKRFSSFVFFVAIVDIALRILTFIGNNIGLKDLSTFINNHFPGSIFAIINNYTSGDLNIIFKWLFVVIMIMFLYYVIKIFIKKKKI